MARHSRFVLCLLVTVVTSVAQAQSDPPVQLTLRQYMEATVEFVQKISSGALKVVTSGQDYNQEIEKRANGKAIYYTTEIGYSGADYSDSFLAALQAHEEAFMDTVRRTLTGYEQYVFFRETGATKGGIGRFNSQFLNRPGEIEMGMVSSLAGFELDLSRSVVFLVPALEAIDALPNQLPPDFKKTIKPKENDPEFKSWESQFYLFLAKKMHFTKDEIKLGKPFEYSAGVSWETDSAKQRDYTVFHLLNFLKSDPTKGIPPNILRVRVSGGGEVSFNQILELFIAVQLRPDTVFNLDMIIGAEPRYYEKTKGFFAANQAMRFILKHGELPANLTIQLRVYENGQITDLAHIVEGKIVSYRGRPVSDLMSQVQMRSVLLEDLGRELQTHERKLRDLVAESRPDRIPVEKEFAYKSAITQSLANMGRIYEKALAQIKGDFLDGYGKALVEKAFPKIRITLEDEAKSKERQKVLENIIKTTSGGAGAVGKCGPQLFH